MSRVPAAGPGLVNAHTHLYSGLASLGLPDPSPRPENFLQILERLWWRLDRALDAESLRAAARYYIADALLHGTTTIVDHHESPEFIDGSLDVLAAACEELGIRALLCYGATERNRGRQEAKAGLAECRRFARQYKGSLVKPLVGVHASFTVSDQTLEDAAGLCRELDTVLHVHCAEDQADVADAIERGYEGPLERLVDLGAVPPGSILAHGVHLSESQVVEAERRNLWLVHNPRSNQGNRVGWAGALLASRRVALGTDGFPSDMRVEGEALLRIAMENHTPLDSTSRVADCLAAGNGLVAGRFLETGAADRELGDEVFFEDSAPGDRGTAMKVTVAGKVVVENGKLTTADFDEIRAHAQEELSRLTKRMAAL